MPGWLDKIKHTRFLIKLTHWEYWPFGIIQFPLFFYYPWLSLKSGSFTFFSGANPRIVMGGMFGESKYDVLSMLPASVRPKTLRIHQPASVSQILYQMNETGLSFPVIFKPDLGERGFMVRKIDNPYGIDKYLHDFKNDFLIQEYVDLPLEFGVFYKRYPDDNKGVVTSIVMKEMLYVIGDGRSTLVELIRRNDRAWLQWSRLKASYAERLEQVLPLHQKLELVSIGNHCLGTKFINANFLISEAVNEAFDLISKQIDNFYFGRFDLRCRTFDDLASGRVMVVELNGCGAEPAHIYDPSFSLWRAVMTLIDHWTSIFEIAKQNRKRGFRFIPLKEAIGHYRNFKSKVK